jgi:hypothetical protein
MVYVGGKKTDQRSFYMTWLQTIRHTAMKPKNETKRKLTKTPETSQKQKQNKKEIT